MGGEESEMIKLDKSDITKLENMFSGDESRDASSGIRGFLFQDLVAIDNLLDSEVDYVCTEYLEDVDVFTSDKVKIMQVKYYPKTSPNRKEIMSDLYYQYLRTQVLDYKLNVIPFLVIHRNARPKDTTLSEMKKEYVNVDRDLKPDDEEDVEGWLIKSVYSESKKEKQKQVLFNRFAYNESIQKFLNNFEINHVKDSLKVYSEKVKEKLGSVIPDNEGFDDDDERLRILLGLAQLFVQERYNEGEKKSFEEHAFRRDDLISYLSSHVENKTDILLISYIFALVDEVFIDIVEDNEMLTEKQVEMLDIIYMNTKEWLEEMLSTAKGQFRLLNTISHKKKEKLQNFESLSPRKRYEIVIAHEGNLISYLYYLWKIIMNLNSEILSDKFDSDTFSLTPSCYINDSCDDCICMNFETDSVDKSILLPYLPSDRLEKIRDDVYSRLFDIKPRKWYMSGDLKGDFEYTFNVADTGDGSSVLDIGKDGYRIECMKCIGVDKGKWVIMEKCTDCIFTNKCIREE